jgi:hypothetical protein
MLAANLTDPEIARGYQALVSLLTTPTELFAEPGLADRVMRLGGDAPAYPIPGPDRRELLAAVGE